mmetsp:Transcript_93/g.148  ORF Transcript_93/g.148 Transcript_93/m.148 type:complete len:328 (+) Transcript_93:115-1098(+)|eukprot:CAMPEP_0119107448 /NCGR_PEP_ID=MMETSP1180-20130426/10191_1 /TAXON_ID=3052 ORGANISM="Chlamydomonas cf sp, Strain CCMP681" /NCGR_SAMPLE_ID=MMETSP1180 /ASSEMBLY_ACC=CAM_ASM_000741 /LENGTH=327 /DNA_ID=CAMNT_0007092935 /DNA_START=112 /DNA_END=1095 /DNA_ORIENTATION=+
MRPFLLKGHDRPLTQVKFNREGDLLISCGKNTTPCVWWSDDGKRLGTFEGHTGAVWSCDMTWDSDRLVTASADQSVRVWDMQTGETMYTWKMGEPCRAINLSVGEKLLAYTTDAFMGTSPMVHVVKFDHDSSQMSAKPVMQMIAPKGRITRVYWTDMNRSMVTSHDGGFMRKWDTETGQQILEKQVHEDAIQDMQLSPDGSYVVTASLDKTAKLIDLEDFSELKVYKTGRFVQSAAISPAYDHVLLGGGQDASQVTTTAAKAGGFEARFFHKIYQEEFGQVRGHFGPINTVAFSPDGKSFVTGGEDGYVRLHHMGPGEILKATEGLQ